MHRKFWAQLTRMTMNSRGWGEVGDNDQRRVLGGLRGISKMAQLTTNG